MCCLNNDLFGELLKTQKNCWPICPAKSPWGDTVGPRPNTPGFQKAVGEGCGRFGTQGIAKNHPVAQALPTNFRVYATHVGSESINCDSDKWETMCFI